MKARSHYDKENSIFEGVEHHDFGVVDNKGRAVGAKIAYSVATYVPASEESRTAYLIEPGTYYRWYPHATRAGESFGALAGERLCKTEAERIAHVEKYLADAKKRALKAWA